MKQILHIMILVFLALLLNGCAGTANDDAKPGPSKVELIKETDGYKLYCDGKPFYIKGAGLEGGDIKGLAARGANAMRTWRTDNRIKNGQEVLDEAHKNGLMVCMGIELGRERHGFNYDDTGAVQKQFDYAKGEVMKYKDHPSLLVWGIGNELNLHSSNTKVWEAVNDISEMIHEIDPNHPTTTMLAGANKDYVLAVMNNCPSIDFISFQLYGDILNLPRYIKEVGYEGAFVVSEWGATGHWEVGKTEWGRPIEQTSSEKAIAYHERYKNAIAGQPEQCIGSFVFLWGQKQERTPTWYGMFLEGGEKTESVDVMQYVWTGKWPENRTPVLNSFLLEGKTAFDNIYLYPGQIYNANVEVEDYENDKISYHWEIIPEVPIDKQSEGGDFEQQQLSLFKKDSEDHSLQFKAPANKGEYRLFVYAFDGHNNAATANIPFFIRD